MITMSRMRSHKLVLFFAISCLLLQEKCTDASVRLLCKESERKALLEFKHNLQAMDSSGHDALFHGKVRSAIFGMVSIATALQDTLKCSILFTDNEFFGYLKNLKLLDLSNANFGGPIPSQLGNFSMLETLGLGDSSIDMTFRHNLKKMFSIGNLEWLSHLSRLKQVYLSFTYLSNADDWSQVISHLSFLEELFMTDCDLPSISSSSPSSTNSSTSLTHLDLSANNLPSSPIYPWLFNVSRNLLHLNLSSNQLKGPIPKAFRNMNAIKNLYLSDNLLTLAENEGILLMVM
ncbi:hypothetical protein J1N35_028429 [Gossypium stocksii]|uniref:Leucine-rich repeat-containing N-terminal plant-type domain-containing protein n=1 Tax=Gossypium stocksii TaxID=47602 RepID=A0A9D3ZSH0_9ROSI|nr:hypothetical protein J1N35_028429 [Gossypium stocksii]